LKEICLEHLDEFTAGHRERGGKVFLICGETAANQKASSLRETTSRNNFKPEENGL
jgi:hypothetical protein